MNLKITIELIYIYLKLEYTMYNYYKLQLLKQNYYTFYKSSKVSNFRMEIM